MTVRFDDIANEVRNSAATSHTNDESDAKSTPKVFLESHDDQRAVLPLNTMSFRLNFASTTVSCISKRNINSLSPG
jgi:hypothetical protein